MVYFNGMFPLLWRYLIYNYLQVFILSVVAFIAILLTSRLEEIARFASLGADLTLIGLFALFQIPYILPIAIPVGCLIAATLLMQRLSRNGELTALRSAGFSIRHLMTPVILVSVLISIFNFYTVSELATTSHLHANLLKNKLFSINPLLLLNNKHLMRMKGFYYESFGNSKVGQSAHDVLIAVPNQSQRSLSLILASQAESTDQEFKTKSLSMITPLKNHELLLETVGSSTFSIDDFSNLIQKKVYHPSYDTLNMKLLLSNKDKKIYSEIARRISAGLSPFSFTLLGLAFGMSLSRLKNPFQLVFPVGLAALYLISFFAAKAFESKIFLSYTLYLIPHGIIVLSSLRKIRKINRGVV